MTLEAARELRDQLRSLVRTPTSITVPPGYGPDGYEVACATPYGRVWVISEAEATQDRWVRGLLKEERDDGS